MKPKSAKAKGRKAQQYVRDRIREVFNLQNDDVRSTGMGQSGEDIQLSPAARAVFPFSVEVKAQEKVNIWKAWDQSSSNCPPDCTATVILKRNRSPYLAVIDLETLLQLIKNQK